jgi:hypothetical protein
VAKAGYSVADEFELLALGYRDGLPPRGTADNWSAEPPFKLDGEVHCAWWAPDTLRLSQEGERFIMILQ